MASNSVAEGHRAVVRADRSMRPRSAPSRSISIRAIAVGGVLIGALTGCSHTPQLQTAPSPQTSATAGRLGSDSAALSVSPVPHDLQPTPAATPAEHGAIHIALQAMGRFCRPQLHKQQWIAGLDPFLTLEAASAYATVDPARVGCARTVSPARLLEGDDFTQVVAVQTDRSTYRITASRSSLSDSWRVSLITPGGTR